LEHLIFAIIVGAFVGWVASLIMKTRAQMGILADILVGIAGSWLGNWLFTALGLLAYGMLGRLIVNVTGAVLLIAILKAFRVFR